MQNQSKAEYYGVVPIHRAAALSLTTKLLDSELSESHRLDQPDVIIINSNCPVIENSIETANFLLTTLIQHHLKLEKPQVL